MIDQPVSYKRYRFPPQIIAHAVWLYFRFPLSLRLVEEMLAERGIVLSHETIRRWAMKFGPDFARRLKRKAPGRDDIWHLDEVVIDIAGEKRWLWRAVDQDGYVLDEIVQKKRDKNAATKLVKRLLKKQGIGPKLHRQSRLLRRGEEGHHAGDPTPLPQGAEQPGGELPFADPETGEADAGISILAKPAAFRIRLLRHPKLLRSSPPRILCLRPASSSPPRFRGVEIGCRHARLKGPAPGALAGRQKLM